MMAGPLLGWALMVAGVPGAADPPLLYTIVVGNNLSLDSTIPDLRYADDDAILYYRLLAPYSRRIALLTLIDDASQVRHADMPAVSRIPAKAELRNELQDTFAQIKEARLRGNRQTELIFVFVGHGGLDNEGKGFVHLADDRVTRADIFHDIIAASPADYTHLIIDACNAFSVVAGRGQQHSSGVAAETLFERFLSGHELENYPRVGVLAATSDAHETHEWSRIQAGVFSHQVRSALSGAADINNDRRLEYSEVAAFVDAASSELASVGKQVTTFAWPPLRDRRVALLDASQATGLRVVGIAKEVHGRFFLESGRGEIWAEFHAAENQEMHLHVPASEDFFIRDGTREEVLRAGPEAHWIEGPLRVEYPVTSRGAVGQAFEQNLFAIPFSRAYYRGFVSGRRHLFPVHFRTTADPGLAAETHPRWRAGYTFSTGLFPGVGLEHGVYARLNVPLWRFVSFQQTIEGAWATLVPQNRISSHNFFRAALLPGIGARLQLGESVAVAGVLELGYGAAGIFGRHDSMDSSVGFARSRVDVEVALAATLWLQFAVSYAAVALTHNDREQIKALPQFAVGLGWN